jgi:hypothetical protein
MNSKAPIASDAIAAVVARCGMRRRIAAEHDQNMRAASITISAIAATRGTGH